MRSVGLKVLKNKLSEYVRLAASGETVLVTDRDRVVAELVPRQAGRRKPSDNVFVARGVREGWLTPASVVRQGPPPAGDPVITFEELIHGLDHDRGTVDLSRQLGRARASADRG